MLEIFDRMSILLAKTEHKHFLYTKKLLSQEKLGITPGQMTILYALYKKDGIPISELGKMVFLDNSTLTGLIDRMEKSDLVYRAETPGDRRCYCIYLTGKSRELQQDINKAMLRSEAALTSACDETEIAVFRRVLERIYMAL